MPVLSEKRTEDIAKELLEVRGWNTSRPPKGNVLWKNEYREYPHFRAAFAEQSKSRSGAGYPDFLVIDSSLRPLLVGETKAHKGQIDTAVNDARHYADALLSRGFRPLAVGVAGNATEEIEVEVVKHSERGDWQPIKYGDTPIQWIPTLDEATSLVDDTRLFDLEPQVPSQDTLAKYADEINRIFRECKIKDEFRPAVIGAFMLGLVRTRGNVRIDPEHVLVDINHACEQAFANAGKSELAGSIMVPAANQALAVRAPEIIYILRLLNLTTLTAAHDYLGQLYETFFRFTGGNTIGQFFTPRHITQFIVDLCEVSARDVLVDPTCGTGGFLIAALYRMIGRFQYTKEQITSLVAEHLIGFESEPITAALCVANMIIRGDGTTGVKLGDCFDDPRYPTAGATVSVGNPPFPHKKTDAPPEKFINRALEALHPRGQCAMIVPASLLSKSDKSGWRKDVLARNTLKAVITLPHDLFQPYASSTTGVVLLERGIPHREANQTFFCHISNDGFKLKKSTRVPRSGEQLSITKRCYLDHASEPGLCSFARLDGFETGDEWSPGVYITSAEHSSDDILFEVDTLVSSQVAFHATHAREITDLADALASGRLTPRRYRDITRSRAVNSTQAGSIGSLFDIYYGQRSLHSKERLLPGASLIISSQGTDNGCYGFFGFEEIVSAPFVAVPSTGSIGEASIQLWPCGIADDCLLLIPKPGTTEEQMWIAAASVRLERWRFHYGRKITPDRISNLLLSNDQALATDVRKLLDSALPCARNVVQALSGQLPPVRPREARRTFEYLAEQWKAETSLMSNPATIVLNEHYQRIIGLGEQAVPLILEELRRGEYYEWFWALRAITGQNPVPEESAGKVEEMSDAWLQWGIKTGYLNAFPQAASPSSQTSLSLDI